ncbi:MAG TPA: ABC transporter ATP-binding protein [Xanthobacteraceae bacterium]|jgi:branched-chain amino acid transport system ATP-binding protein
MPLLALENVTHFFGGLAAVRNLSFTVEGGAIRGLIGPNGSGKSTVFNIISGYLPLFSGRIRFETRDITNRSTPSLVETGIARTFQATQIFDDLTVEENVTVSSQVIHRESLAKSFLRRALLGRGEVHLRARAEEILELAGLSGTARHVARDLPYRDQKMLALANAMATGAKLLMLDEPMAGLTMQETRAAMDVVRWARDRGTTILLIEHDMRCVMELCDSIVVLDHGEKICDGTPSEVRRNPQVIEIYLGADECST